MLCSELRNMCIFHQLEVVCRGSETQLQVGEHLNYLIERLKDGDLSLSEVADTPINNLAKDIDVNNHLKFLYIAPKFTHTKYIRHFIFKAYTLAFADYPRQQRVNVLITVRNEVKLRGCYAPIDYTPPRRPHSDMR